MVTSSETARRLVLRGKNAHQAQQQNEVPRSQVEQIIVTAVSLSIVWLLPSGPRAGLESPAVLYRSDTNGEHRRGQSPKVISGISTRRLLPDFQPGKHQARSAAQVSAAGVTTTGSADDEDQIAALLPSAKSSRV